MNSMLKVKGIDSLTPNKFTTLLHIIPHPLFTDMKDCVTHVDEVHQYFIERDKDVANADEVGFLLVIDRYIQYFEKAKAMVAKNSFTVKYHGGHRVNDPDIWDYEIISLPKK